MAESDVARSDTMFPSERSSNELDLQRKYKKRANKDINYDVIKLLLHVNISALIYEAQLIFSLNTSPPSNSIAIVKRPGSKMLHFTRLIKFLVQRNHFSSPANSTLNV